MAQQFEYDEKGSTFLYFLLSFFAMLLIPLSYVFWPKGFKEEEKRLRNHCRIHGKSKWFQTVQENLQRKKSKPSFQKFFIGIAWIAFFILVYKVSNIEHDHVEYNPYELLGVNEDATPKEIKKRFRQLSLEMHPDKGGDPETFMSLRKAYEALTDEETMENWKLHGNPDGPQALQVGIALPKWIFESNNSAFVLGVYVFMFMILLPVMVGRWWYRSIKYSKEQVLLHTTQLYYYFLNKTPNMNLKRALLILSASFEFSREHNSQVRAPTLNDNVEVPELIRQLEIAFNVNENAKERPMNFPYSVKARTLMNCHLCRLDISSSLLAADLDFILKKSPLLVQEMVACISQLTVMAHWNKAPMPRLETLENVMKLSPMMVQGLRESKSPLLQLPYFTDDFVKFAHTNKRCSARNLRSLVQVRDADRRQMLRRMGDEEYDTMMTVLRNFPDVELDVRTHVIDDDETHVITAGAIVTVTLTMTRRFLGDLVEGAEVEQEEQEQEEEEEDEDEKPQAANQQKLKPWEKQAKRKKKKKQGGKGGAKKQQAAVRKVSLVEKKADGGGDAKESDASGGSDESGSESEAEVVDEDKEEQEWQAMQATFKKKEQAALTVVDKRTHTVYAPTFPAEKQEWWWVYACDRRRHLLLTAPVLVCNLVDQQEIELKFPAPQKPGRYTYMVWVRSDSYLDCDQRKEIKLDVKEARPVDDDHPQWQMPTDDEDDDANVSEDEGISSEDQDDDAYGDE